MRTNVELDDELIEKARQLTGLKTKRAILDQALRTLVQLGEQAEIRSLRGRLRWEGDLELMRESRVGDLG